MVYPPIDTKKFQYNKSKNYWLSVNRLLSQKRVDMQIKAFQKLKNENLITVGSYEKGSKNFELYKKYLEKICPKNVKIINWVSDEELVSLYSNCKGFITTSLEEDFGMTPIEAMASGKPVIAPNEGGYKESIINGKTGILIDNINEDKLVNSITKLGREIDKNPLKFKNVCQKQAKKFDTSIFIKKIKDEIYKTLKNEKWKK